MSMANNSSNHFTCYNIVDFVESGEPVTSAAMFSASVLGNAAALVVLEVRRRMTSPSLYQVLVTALLATDLFGSVSVSPVIISSHVRGKTLVGMGAGGAVCSYFGFSMTVMSLCTLVILWVLAIERYLSIGHPYFYQRHLSKRCGYVTIALTYLGSVLFSVAPFMGFGGYVQYCPGTWCFLEMSHREGMHKVHIGLYASFILVLISSTVVCNICVIYHLVVMHRRHQVSAPSGDRRCLSMSEEVENLLPLAVITVVFIWCTFPLVLRVYINITGSHEESHEADFGALRFLSFHSIINPWVFIILRPSILKIIWRKLEKSQMSTFIWGKTLTTRCPAPEAGN